MDHDRFVTQVTHLPLHSRTVGPLHSMQELTVHSHPRGDGEVGVSGCATTDPKSSIRSERAPAADPARDVDRTSGITSSGEAPGLCFVGLNVMRPLSSGLFYGVGRDAEFVVDHIPQRKTDSTA